MRTKLSSENKRAKSEKKAILKQRAQLLKVADDVSITEGVFIDGLEFQLSNEKYAIDSSYINEIIHLKYMTDIPCTPSFILGIVNLRGKIISVIDIKKFFNLPAKGITNLNKAIIVSYQDIELGILADEVIGHTSIDLNKLQSNVTTITELTENFILGVSAERLIVLDIIKFLSDKRLIINEEILS